MSGIKDFNHWMTRYYGNNDYGYRPQRNRLSDLLYQPQNFIYTNENFSKPQMNYQQNYQPQQYQQQPVSYGLPSKYEVVVNDGQTKYMDEGTYGRHMSNIDNADDSYDRMAAYRRMYAR